MRACLFWTPAEHLPALEAAYNRDIVPLLARHGFRDGQVLQRSPGASKIATSCAGSFGIGHYYNFEYLDKKHSQFGIVLADVSGKGMQAATVAMRFNEMLRYESRDCFVSADILRGLDGALRGNISSGMFVTCGFGIFDVGEKTLEFTSAGSPPFCYFSASENVVHTFTVPGIPLGMSLPLEVETPFQSKKLILEPGDVVVWVSDGVEDARNSADEFYDWDRLTQRIYGSARQRVSAEAIRNEIVADVDQFSGGASRADDLTVIVFKMDE